MTRYLPDAAIGPTGTAVLLAVATQARPTVRSVAESTGIAISTSHWWLRRLKAEGLVTWAEDSRGTLRATVDFVPVGAPA